MQYGYDQYKAQSINTMTKGEQIVALFDEVVKNLTKSEIAIKSQNYELMDISVQKSIDIVKYLSDILDRSIPISKELLRMYEFFIYEFNRIKAGRRIEVVEEIKPLVIEMRDTFKEANRIASK